MSKQRRQIGQTSRERVYISLLIVTHIFTQIVIRTQLSELSDYSTNHRKKICQNKTFALPGHVWGLTVSNSGKAEIMDHAPAFLTDSVIIFK